MLQLLTGPIRSGKTTRLRAWARTRIDVRGFLTPQSGGARRTLLDVATGTTHAFEVSAEERTRHAARELVAVGRFVFYRAAFEWGRAQIQAYLADPHGTFLLDEYGKLETRGAGFQPEADRLLRAATAPDFPGRVVVVMREGLACPFGVTTEVRSFVG